MTNSINIQMPPETGAASQAVPAADVGIFVSAVSRLPDLPVALKHGAGARLGDTLYVGLGSAGRDWYAIDLAAAAPAWRPLAPFPGLLREQPVAIACAGRIWVLGGIGRLQADAPLSVLDDIHCFDPARGEWERLAQRAPVGLLGATACSIGDSEVLFFGGANKALIDSYFAGLAQDGDGAQRTRDYLSRPHVAYGFNDQVLGFRPADGQWRSLGRVPHVPTVGAASAQFGNQVTLVNGELKPGLRTDAAQQVDITSGALRWHALPPLPAPDGHGVQEGLAGGFAGHVGQVLIVAGGTNFPGARKRYEAGHLYAHEGLSKAWHDQIYAFCDGRWRLAGRLPQGLAHGLAFDIPDGLVIVGGEVAAGEASAQVHLLRRDGATHQASATRR